MVKQRAHDIGLEFESRIQYDAFEETFELRLKDPRISIPKGIESFFSKDTTQQGKSIQGLIAKFKKLEQTRLEQELFKQKKRLNEAKASLKEKSTKKAENDLRITEKKVPQLESKLKRLHSPELRDSDYRFYPFHHVPFYTMEDGVLIERIGRYHLRMNHFEEDFDRKYPGCYNARLDSIQGFWKPVFGVKHGFVIVDRFFENVETKLYLKKHKLPDAQKMGHNLVLEFAPKNMDHMIIPVIWDEWKRKGSPTLTSFAILTDEPPQEVSATGHNRCPIFLNPERISDWLNPRKKSGEELLNILSDRVKPFYEHTVLSAAA